jgi:hypothetical protein
MHAGKARNFHVYFPIVFIGKKQSYGTETPSHESQWSASAFGAADRVHLQSKCLGSSWSLGIQVATPESGGISMWRGTSDLVRGADE